MNDKGQILIPLNEPRRLWDLYSNRVIPFNVADIESEQIISVSHAWLVPEGQQKVDTPINGFEWPVPIPRDTTLECVRVELLNHGLEYVWVDVLCLRQEGIAEKEDLRKEEWKVDVPTIGAIYNGNGFTICYFSGLGQPFEVGDLVSDRHWFNRVWTLQESTARLVAGGITINSPRPDNTLPASHPFRVFYDKLDAIKNMLKGLGFSTEGGGGDMYALLDNILRRSAHSELDKVSGLAYILRCEHILPGFILGQGPEVTWKRLIEAMYEKYRVILFFGYPVAGDDPDLVWCPSWKQIKRRDWTWRSPKLEPRENIDYEFEQAIYSLGLSFIFEGALRDKGSNIFEVSTGQKGYTFNRQHTASIPDGQYTFIGSRTGKYWVVGHGDAQGFTKLSTLEWSLENEADPTKLFEKDDIVLL